MEHTSFIITTTNNIPVFSNCNTCMASSWRWYDALLFRFRPFHLQQKFSVRLRYYLLLYGIENVEKRKDNWARNSYVLQVKDVQIIEARRMWSTSENQYVSVCMYSGSMVWPWGWRHPPTIQGKHKLQVMPKEERNGYQGILKYTVRELKAMKV